MTETIPAKSPKARRVSNSEAGTWLTCQRKYYYAFDLGIVPKPHIVGFYQKKTNKDEDEKVRTLDVGNLGHEILAMYYSLLKQGYSVEQSIKECQNELTKIWFSKQHYTQAVVTHTTTILNRYWEFYAIEDDKKYVVVDVEKEYDLSLTEDYNYVFRFDLLLMNRKTEQLGLVDHKFKYDFFTDESINLSGQMPKYLGALRYNGIWPEWVWLNQIRARSPFQSWGPKDFFRRSLVAPSNNKVANAMREQIIASQTIVEWRQLPLEVKKATALRSMDSFPRPCDRCPFNLICRMEYDGGNITNVIAADFTQNPYNYNRDELL